MADLDVGKIVDAARDAVEKGVVAAGAMLGIDLRSHVAEARDARAEHGAPSGQPYRIEEIIDGETGAMVVTVTDGAQSVDCPTLDDAKALLEALEQRGITVDRTSVPAPVPSPSSRSGRAGSPDRTSALPLPSGRSVSR